MSLKLSMRIVKENGGGPDIQAHIGSMGGGRRDKVDGDGDQIGLWSRKMGAKDEASTRGVVAWELKYLDLAALCGE